MGSISWPLTVERPAFVRLRPMEPVTLLMLAVLGLIGGALSGLIGVGGGIFFVPALILVMGYDIRQAVAVSLVIVIFSSLSGTLRNLGGEDRLDPKLTAVLSATVAPAALLGVAISRVSPDRLVEVMFALLLLGIVYPTIRGSSASEGSQGRLKLPVAVVLAAGVVIGALSGLVGVGGGILMVPLMVLGLGVRPKVAIATSLAVAFFTGVVGTAGYVATGFDEFSSLPTLIIGSIVGAWASVKIRHRMPDRALRIIFALFMVGVALQLLFSG